MSFKWLTPRGGSSHPSQASYYSMKSCFLHLIIDILTAGKKLIWYSMFDQLSTLARVFSGILTQHCVTGVTQNSMVKRIIFFPGIYLHLYELLWSLGECWSWLGGVYSFLLECGSGNWWQISRQNVMGAIVVMSHTRFPGFFLMASIYLIVCLSVQTTG